MSEEINPYATLKETGRIVDRQICQVAERVAEIDRERLAFRAELLRLGHNPGSILERAAREAAAYTGPQLSPTSRPGKGSE